MNALSAKSRSTRSIIWAVDLFETISQAHSSLVSKLTQSAKEAQIEIQPIYILSSQKVERQNECQKSESSELSEAQSQAFFLKNLSVQGLCPVQIIATEALSRYDRVAAVIDAANEHDSPFIVVTSHGRNSLGRFALGSFAEDLLSLAPVPVLFLTHLRLMVHPECGFRRVLFATDFSDHSKLAFLNFLPHAQLFNLKVVLFCSVSLPSLAVASGYGAALTIPENYFLEELNWAKKQGTKWVALANEQNVECELCVQDDGIGPIVAQLILNMAQQEQVDIVVMTSANVPVLSFILGSVAQDVFRSNRLPVWLYGPKSLI
jgi:nucleotide-binding universal stress UspA family protein